MNVCFVTTIRFCLYTRTYALTWFYVTDLENKFIYTARVYILFKCEYITKYMPIYKVYVYIICLSVSCV